jgi:hypothetical protein
MTIIDTTKPRITPHELADLYETACRLWVHHSRWVQAWLDGECLRALKALPGQRFCTLPPPPACYVAYQDHIDERGGLLRSVIRGAVGRVEA